MQIYNNHDGSTGRISTSKGNQIKLEVNGIWYKADFLGYEGAAEYVCSELIRQSNIDSYVQYELCSMTINDTVYNACKSNNFLPEGAEIITADRLFKKNIDTNFPDSIRTMPLEQKIKYFVEHIIEQTHIVDFGAQLTKMLEFDRLVLNDDRHYNNIAFIKDDTGYRLTPLFDNEGAFLSDIRDSYPLEKNVHGLITSVSAKPFSQDFDKQVEICQKLYGTQLKMEKTANIHKNTIQALKDQYGDKVTNRITTVFDHQKYLYPEIFVGTDLQEHIQEEPDETCINNINTITANAIHESDSTQTFDTHEERDTDIHLH